MTTMRSAPRDGRLLNSNLTSVRPQPHFDVKTIHVDDSVAF
jgi:hypothetical protein